MGVLSLAAEGKSQTLPIAFGTIFIISSLLVYLFSRPSIPGNAPKQTKEQWPILGALSFFSHRFDFWKRSMAQSHTGNFSFYAGQHPVVGLSKDERKVFFEDKRLGFAEGYSALLQGAPNIKKNDNSPFAEDASNTADFSAYFQKRLVALLKGPQLKQGLPQLLRDARTNLDALMNQSSSITDPFDSIYRMIFHFTMRTVACNEVANDPVLLAKTLHLFETMEESASSLNIMFPWIPTWSKVTRTYAGAQLYMIFKNVVDSRNKEGRRDDDALQFLMDNGDDITQMITFVLGSLFAGQLNSGINAAYILCYLATKPYWLERVRDEVNGIAEKYCPDQDMLLKDRLMHVPIEAWEGEFPIIDICLKDVIRLQMPGTAFRKNTSGHDIQLNKSGEVIPPGAYVALAAQDIHLNPQWYTNPNEWDPGRYLPDRAEDKKEPYAWLGWGLARHPCLGMRFAKLENNVIVAMFLAYFDDFQLCDAQGNLMERVPTPEFNNHAASKPKTKIHLKFHRREEGKVA